VGSVGWEGRGAGGGLGGDGGLPPPPATNGPERPAPVSA